MSYAPKGNIVTIPVTAMKWPEQGGTSSFLGSFAMPGSYTLELNKHETAAKVDTPQTLFFDASASTGAVTLTFPNTGQTLTLPAESAGYVPIVTTDQPTFVISGAGGGSVGLTFISVPLPSSVWSVAAGGATSVTAAQGLPNVASDAWPVYITVGGVATSAGNPQPTDDVNLATTIAAGKVAVTDAAAEASLATIVTETTATATNTGAVSAIITSGKLAVADAAAEASLATVATETTATVTALNATSAPVAPGAATATKSDLVGLQYNPSPTEWTAGQQGAASGTAYGALIVDSEGLSPTYSAAGSGTFPSGPVIQIAWLGGSSTKTVRLKRIELSYTSTTSISVTTQVRRASGATAYAGTGVVAGTAVKHDINDAAATAVVAYNSTGAALTAQPGTIVGSLREYSTNTILGSNGNNNVLEIDFSNNGDKSLVIRGTSDWIEIYIFAGASAGSFTWAIEWTEV